MNTRLRNVNNPEAEITSIVVFLWHSSIVDTWKRSAGIMSDYLLQQEIK